MARCSQSDCTIAETGICRDGHKKGCPNLIQEEDGATPSKDSAADAAGAAAKLDERVTFHTGEKLKPPEATRILNDRGARVVLLAGSRDSGKTTFVARLGEMFRSGSVSRYRFAGSMSLCAFERASWLASITSGAASPKTPRTYRTENDTFYHLRLAPEENPRGSTDLLLSDLAGETFPEAVATEAFCASLCSLGRADHLVLLLDCARLSHPAQRHPENDNVRTFLKRVLFVRKSDAKALHVQVVFSRWDYVVRHEQSKAQEEFCTQVQDSLKESFGDSFANLSFHRISARPAGGISPTAGEIQSLLYYWLEAPRYVPWGAASRTSRPARDFSAYGLI